MGTGERKETGCQGTSQLRTQMRTSMAGLEQATGRKPEVRPEDIGLAGLVQDHGFYD